MKKSAKSTQASLSSSVSPLHPSLRHYFNLLAKSLEYYLKTMLGQLKTEYAGQKVKLTPSHL
jgi:hypothetical protein